MVQISPQNIAIASLIILIAGLAGLGLVSAAIPSAEVILGLAGLVALIGYAGLFFAYYYAAVNVWDAGNPAGAIIFLVGPILAATLLSSGVLSYGTPDGVYFFWYLTGYLIGLVLGSGELLLSILFAVAALYIGVRVKRNIIKQRLLGISASEPVIPPSPPVLIMSAILLTLLLWAGFLGS